MRLRQVVRRTRRWCALPSEIEKAGSELTHNRPYHLDFLEREKGFEPSTSTLARSHSTTELLPHSPGRENPGSAASRGGPPLGPEHLLSGIAPVKARKAGAGDDWKPGFWAGRAGRPGRRVCRVRGFWAARVSLPDLDLL